MKNLIKHCFVVLLFFFISRNLLIAQANVDCLCTPGYPDNFNSLAVDTCGYVRFYASDTTCDGLWNPEDFYGRALEEKRIYSKIGWKVHFKNDAIVLPAVPHDSIVEVGWDRIDTSFVSLRFFFQSIENKYGKFILRKNDPEFSTGELSWYYSIFFDSYVNFVEFTEYTSSYDSADIYFNHYPIWWDDVKEEEKLEKLLIYPNPTYENITISFPQNTFLKTSIRLCDITGREIFLKEIDALQDSYTFSVQEIPTGVYLLEVRSGNEVFTKQVSVIR